MAKKLTKTQLSAALALIVAATQAGSFHYTTEAEHGPLIAEGLVEVNPEMKEEGTGKLATRATAKGIEQAGAGSAAPAAAPKPVFTLEKAALPPVSGRGRTAGSERYPFSEMEVGHSFFIPASAEMPEPAKSLASTVSGATKRYAEIVPGETREVTVKGKDGNPDTVKHVPVLKETRKFVVRSRTAAAEQAEGFSHGNDGARVYRVA